MLLAFSLLLIVQLVYSVFGVYRFGPACPEYFLDLSQTMFTMMQVIDGFHFMFMIFLHLVCFSRYARFHEDAEPRIVSACETIGGDGRQLVRSDQGHNLMFSGAPN